MALAVASAGSYANHLQLAPDCNHADYRPDALPDAQPTVSPH